MGRFVLVTHSMGTVPFSRLKGRSADQQLLAQRPEIDRFIRDASTTTLSVRTHYPWQLWGILGLLCIGGSLLSVWLWLPIPDDKA